MAQYSSTTQQGGSKRSAYLSADEEDDEGLLRPKRRRTSHDLADGGGWHRPGGDVAAYSPGLGDGVSGEFACDNNTDVGMSWQGHNQSGGARATKLAGGCAEEAAADSVPPPPLGYSIGAEAPAGGQPELLPASPNEPAPAPGPALRPAPFWSPAPPPPVPAPVWFPQPRPARALTRTRPATTQHMPSAAFPPLLPPLPPAPPGLSVSGPHIAADVDDNDAAVAVFVYQRLAHLENQHSVPFMELHTALANLHPLLTPEAVREVPGRAHAFACAVVAKYNELLGGDGDAPLSLPAMYHVLGAVRSRLDRLWAAGTRAAAVPVVRSVGGEMFAEV